MATKLHMSQLAGATEWHNSEPLGPSELRGHVVLLTFGRPSTSSTPMGSFVPANYRPRDTVLFLSRLLGEHFAGSPIGEHFATPEA
jgi:hypothetical protein